jgi:hypothetical protein
LQAEVDIGNANCERPASCVDPENPSQCANGMWMIEIMLTQTSSASKA